MQRVLNIGLLALLALGLIKIIAIRAIGEWIIPKLRIEKAYMITVSIVLCVIIVSWIAEMIISKKILFRRLSCLVVLLAFTYIIWPVSSKTELLIKNNSEADIVDIEISDAYEKYKIRSISKQKEVNIPISLSSEDISKLFIKGQIVNGKKIEYSKELYSGWYIKKRICIIVSPSGNVSYDETDLP